MLVNKIICPKCGSSLTSKAGVAVGTAIACPKCKERFKVAAPPEEPEEDFEVVDEAEPEEEAPRKPAPKPVVKKRVVEGDEEEDRPKPKKRRPAEDDEEEEERPKAKKRARDDDDDDDRPKKKKKKKRRDEELSAYGKLKSNIWVRASVLGVLLIILGVLIYLKLIKKDESSSSSSNPDSSSTTEEEELAKPIVLASSNQPAKAKSTSKATELNSPAGPPRVRPVGNVVFAMPGEVRPDCQVAVSADGKRTAIAYTNPGTGESRTQVWHIGTAPPRMLSEFPGQLLAFSPDGGRVFTSGGPAVFDVETMARVAELPTVGHTFAAFLDEKNLLAVGRDGARAEPRAEGRVTVWNTVENAEAGSFDVRDSRFKAAAVVKGGRELWLFMADRPEIECWDIGGKSFVRAVSPKANDLKGFDRQCSVADDGSVFVIDGPTPAFFDELGRSVASVPAFAMPYFSGFVPGTTTYVGFAGKEKGDAGYQPMDAVLFDCKTQKPSLVLTGRTPEPFPPYVAVSRDRTVAVAASPSGKVNLYVLPPIGNGGAVAVTPKSDTSRPAGTDLPRLQGEWRVAVMNINGEPGSAEAIADLKWIFNGPQAKSPLETAAWQMKLDASLAPAQIDFTDAAGQVTKAIYRFADPESVEICHSLIAGGTRPKAFKAEQDSNSVMFVLKRAK